MKLHIHCMRLVKDKSNYCNKYYECRCGKRTVRALVYDYIDWNWLEK